MIFSTAVRIAARCSLLRRPWRWPASRLVTESPGGGRIRDRQMRRLRPGLRLSGEAGARAAALKQCKGDCTAVTMKRACAAFSVDMANPCGAHGYAVKPRISSSLNAATQQMLRIRRQGMRDPRLGLRRQGVRRGPHPDRSAPLRASRRMDAGHMVLLLMRSIVRIGAWAPPHHEGLSSVQLPNRADNLMYF